MAAETGGVMQFLDLFLHHDEELLEVEDLVAVQIRIVDHV